MQMISKRFWNNHLTLQNQFRKFAKLWVEEQPMFHAFSPSFTAKSNTPVTFTFIIVVEIRMIFAAATYNPHMIFAA